MSRGGWASEGDGLVVLEGGPGPGEPGSTQPRWCWGGLCGAAGRACSSVPPHPRTVPEGTKTCPRVPAALRVECPHVTATRAAVLSPHLTGGHRGTLGDSGELRLTGHKRKVWDA